MFQDIPGYLVFWDQRPAGVHVLYVRIMIYYVHMYNPKIFEGGVGHLFHY